jgi:histidine ammonia-lyase
MHEIAHFDDRLRHLPVRSTHGVRPMRFQGSLNRRTVCRVLAALCAVAAAASAECAEYRAIVPTMESATVTLTGHDLTIDQVIDVARHGAKVKLSPEAKQRTTDAYGLLLQAQLEGVVMYGFNRNYGSGRGVVSLDGDPLTPENKAKLEARQLERFRSRPQGGYGPEVADEDIVRAMMVVRANNMTYEFASPQLTQMLQDLINNRITPVVQARGTPGEADLEQVGQVGGTMVGVGEAYYHGERMPAAEALRRAGLKPLQPFAGDDYALESTNAYATGLAALLVADARAALEWADLIYAMDLAGMNSSITPLSWPVQVSRPHPWLNWQAARVLDMLKGSYLFADDPKRILQDPESLRASAIRQGSAWLAWGHLRDAVLFQMNSSDHNPTVLVGMTPKDSWELATPQMMNYYVKGGKYSDGKPGFIVSSANWDPYPLANELEAFTIALANMDVVVEQRIQRFSEPFITGVSAADILTAEQLANSPHGAGVAGPDTLFQELVGLANPVTPAGNTGDQGIGDIQSESRLKAVRARDAVDQTLGLLGLDLIRATFWMDLRKIQEPSRTFGAGPTGAWNAFRAIVPFQQAPDQRPQHPLGQTAYQFLSATPASKFYTGKAPPAPEQYSPTAQVRPRG